MASGIHRLRAGHLRKRGPVKLCDGGGLWLYVTPNNARRWVFRYRFNGKDHELGLGGLIYVSIEEAREIADHLRKAKYRGEDPRHALMALKASRRPPSKTFQECATAYIDSHKDGWSNPKHQQQWRRTLETYAFPTIGDLPVSQIDTPHILSILKPIWPTKNVTATRVRQRIEAILAWAAVQNLRPSHNPAQWHGHLDKILPPPSRMRSVRHQESMPYTNVPTFMQELAQKQAISARALEFLVLTVSRTQEVLNATWDEIDLDNRIWNIPAERMKTRKPHRVPLSKQALDLLGRLSHETTHLFPSPIRMVGGHISRPLSNQALLVLMRKMGYGNKGTRGPWVPHGFRSSFRSWAADQTTIPGAIAEMALAHIVKGVEGIYQRSDLLQKRRELMQAWADHCRPPSS